MINILSNRSNAIFLFLFTSFLILNSSNNFGLFLFFVILSIAVLFFKENSVLNLNCFFLGTLTAIFFLFYWDVFFGSQYYLGKYSDDYYYDEVWTKGFVEKYGLDFSKISIHLNNVKNGLGEVHNSKGYIGVILSLKWFSSFFDGYHTLYPRVLNIFFLILTAIYSSKIVHYYTQSKKYKTLTKLAVFFFPVMLFNSSHVFRDTLVSFIIIYVIFNFLSKKRHLINWLIITAMLIFLYYLRLPTFFVLSLIIILINLNPQKVNFRFLFLTLITFILIFFIFTDQTLDIYRKVLHYNNLNVERFGDIGGQIFALPLYIGFFPRLIYLIFTPVPNFDGFHQIYISLTAFIQILFFPILYKAFFFNSIDIKLKYTFLILFTGIALSTASFRHVMMYIPIGISITMITINNIDKQKLFSNYLFIQFGLLSLFVISVALALFF